MPTAYLTKTEIAEILVDRELGQKKQITNILDGLADLCADQLEAGQPFLIPGIGLLDFNYRPPKKKGERWKKGETVQGPMGESVKDSDSAPVATRILLKFTTRGDVSKVKPKASAMSSFMKTKAAKAVIARKGK